MPNSNDVMSELNYPSQHGETELYAPAYLIRLNGKKVAPIESDFLSITVSDSVEELSTFELVLNNWLNPDEPGGPAFKYTDKLFAHVKPGTQVDVDLGYTDTPPLKRMITGEITAVDPRYPASGGSTVVLRGQDRSHRLRNRPRSAAWENVTDAELARQIAGRIGARAEVDPGGTRLPKHRLVPQQNLDDIAFLRERARRINFDVYMRDRKLHFVRSHQRRAPAITLEWGRTLSFFMPSLTFARQVSKVTVRAWHPSEGRLIEKSATRLAADEVPAGEKGAPAQLTEYFGEGKEEVITSEGVLSDEDAAALAQAVLERSSYAFVSGPAEAVGLPDLRAGEIVRLERLGPVFDGDYYVTESTHRLDEDGYRTSFTVSKVYT